mgnify:CR=1 FL=1
MLMNQTSHQSQQYQSTNKNHIFSQHLDTYMPIEDEQLHPPAIEEEVLSEYFISRYGLTLEQINHDMAMCREFEGV